MALETTLQLDARRLFEVPAASAAAIRCLQGSLWLTLDHDPRDIVLEPGDSFALPDQRRCLLYALEPARFVLQPRAAVAGSHAALATAA